MKKLLPGAEGVQGAETAKVLEVGAQLPVEAGTAAPSPTAAFQQNAVLQLTTRTPAYHP